MLLPPDVPQQIKNTKGRKKCRGPEAQIVTDGTPPCYLLSTPPSSLHSYPTPNPHPTCIHALQRVMTIGLPTTHPSPPHAHALQRVMATCLPATHPSTPHAHTARPQKMIALFVSPSSRAASAGHDRVPGQDAESAPHCVGAPGLRAPGAHDL